MAENQGLQEKSLKKLIRLAKKAVKKESLIEEDFQDMMEKAKELPQPHLRIIAENEARRIHEENLLAYQKAKIFLEKIDPKKIE